MVDSFILYIYIVIVILGMIHLFRNFTVVPPNEIHVVSGRRRRIFDGRGRYLFHSFMFTRRIIPKEPKSIMREIAIPDSSNNEIKLRYAGSYDY